MKIATCSVTTAYCAKYGWNLPAVHGQIERACCSFLLDFGTRRSNGVRPTHQEDVNANVNGGGIKNQIVVFMISQALTPDLIFNGIDIISLTLQNRNISGLLVFKIAPEVVDFGVGGAEIQR